jgi:hypothetical protein
MAEGWGFYIRRGIWLAKEAAYLLQGFIKLLQPKIHLNNV